jgi:hypothetical protein
MSIARAASANGVVFHEGVNPEADGVMPFSLSAGQVLSASGSGLTSLKLYFSNIQVCQSVTLNGTAISASSGCITLYTGPAAPAALSATAGASVSALSAALAAAATTTTGYIDVMDSGSLSSLNSSVSLTSANVGSYNFGVVSWYDPIKVTATLSDPTGGAQNFFTHPGTAASCTANSQSYACVQASTSLATGPAQEAIFDGRPSSGSVVFKFQNPFVIASSDISGNTSFTFKLAFNPDSLVQGVVNGATNFPPLADGATLGGGSGANSLSLVDPQISAVFSSSSATVMQESYTTPLFDAGDTGHFNLRLELYYLQSDANKTVYGVALTSVPSSASLSYLTGFPQAYGVSTNADGTIKLTDYSGNTIIDKFARISTVGGTTTGQVACQASFFGSTTSGGGNSGACSPAGALQPASTFTLNRLQSL